MTQPSTQLLAQLLTDDIGGKPFSELFSVTFDHRAHGIIGQTLIDALEQRGLSFDRIDAVGALTTAAIPLVCAVQEAAAKRGKPVNGFVMDFVYPSIKGPSVKGKTVVLLDAWLSEQSYIQTSSLVTLHNGNELNLDFGIVTRQGATVAAIASLIGSDDTPSDSAVIRVVDPTTVDATAQDHRDIPFVHVFGESQLRGAQTA